MKSAITCLAILMWTAVSAFAELTGVSITVHQVREVKADHIKITGYLYSLKSSFSEEQLVRVPLSKLLKKIPSLKNAGSAVIVDITADHDVSSYELSKILKAMGENGYLTLHSLKTNPLGIERFETKQVEQAGADQPTTAPVSKPDENDKPKPKSEDRPQ